MPKIHGLNKTTLLDYPGRVAATVFLGHCNFRCPFCQNSSLVLNPAEEPEIPEEEVLSFLKKRQGILEGVCISGGEPTLAPDLEDFIQKIHNLGYPVKLDTNGTHPEVLKNLADKDLIQKAAVDIKACPENYPACCIRRWTQSVKRLIFCFTEIWIMSFGQPLSESFTMKKILSASVSG